MKNFRLFYSRSFKLFVIGALSLFLLIPAEMIKSLIRERQLRSLEVISEISSIWSGNQAIAGPILSVPLEKTEKSGIIQSRLYLLPDSLSISGEVQPGIKKRGIFSTVVYDSEVILSGHFSLEQVAPVNGWFPRSQDRFIGLGISDLRGLGVDTKVRINGTECDVLPGIPEKYPVEEGIRVRLPEEYSEMKEIKFEIFLPVKGTGSLRFTPTGKINHARMKSTWPDPSFTGAFLPVDRNIDENGFNATWEISYLNRNYPQSWAGNTVQGIEESAFGTEFLIPVDHYQKSTRAVKYAFMFIALSFLMLFISEVFTGSKFHPIQYFLTGSVLLVFFSLLLSLSEHIGFNAAYGVSTLATVILTAVYVYRSLAILRVSLISSTVLLLLYGFLYAILQVQDYALLFGSIGLFVILAVVMYLTGKIDWYREEMDGGNSEGN